MRKLLVMFMTLLMVVLAVAACGGSSITVPTVAPTATEKVEPTAAPTVAPTATEKVEPTAAPTEAAPAGDATAGESIFNQDTIGPNPGCRTCHSLKAGEVLVGPSLAGIAPDAAGDAQAEGISTEEMLDTMVTDPSAEVVKGFADNVMPKDFGKQLTPRQLNDLITYLMTLK